MDILDICFENIKFTLGAEVLSTFCSCFTLNSVVQDVFGAPFFTLAPISMLGVNLCA